MVADEYVEHYTTVRLFHTVINNCAKSAHIKYIKRVYLSALIVIKETFFLRKLRQRPLSLRGYRKNIEVEIYLYPHNGGNDKN